MSDEQQGIRPKNPDTYEGGNKGLERFLSQCQVYFLLKRGYFNTHAEKVLFAGSHLRGPAADWFTPFVRDFSKGETARRETKEMFGSYPKFEQHLEQLYGSRDKQRVSARQLQQLKQTGPASQYTATFRRYATESGWNDAALMTHYYAGLKENIKDELARGDRPDTLDELIDQVITIDERFFERQLERGRPTGGFQPNYPPREQQPRYGPEPMDLSATRGPLSLKDREYRMKNRLCLYCGKPGHRARECRANRTGRQALAATRNQDSYDDDNDNEEEGLPQYLRATRQDYNVDPDQTIQITTSYPPEDNGVIEQTSNNSYTVSTTLDTSTEPFNLVDIEGEDESSSSDSDDTWSLGAIYIRNNAQGIMLTYHHKVIYMTYSTNGSMLRIRDMYPEDGDYLFQGLGTTWIDIKTPGYERMVKDDAARSWSNERRPTTSLLLEGLELPSRLDWESGSQNGEPLESTTASEPSCSDSLLLTECICTPPLPLMEN